MTIKQLEKANEINRKILMLRHFEYNCGSSYIGIVSGKEKEIEISLRDFPDLQDFISSYFSIQIEELEKQMEEL